MVAIQSRCPAAAQWQMCDYTHLVAERDPGSANATPAEYAGRPAAQALVGFCALNYAFGEAELRNLAVAPECRRRGIAAALLGSAHERLRAAGVTFVYLEVRPS